jgi:hypothetical protein
MVKKIKTMHIEEKSFFDESILKLPVLGDISIRQLAYIIIPTIIIYKLTSPLGTIPLAIFMLLTTSISLFIAKKPTKAFKPEEQLYLALLKPQPKTRKRKEKKIEKYAETPPTEYVKKDETVLITGVLRNPATGEPIPNAEILLIINGEKGPTIKTDNKGNYKIYYTFTSRQNTLELMYGDQIIAKKQIIVE